MKLKTAELTGKPLSFALAQALGYTQIQTHVSGKVFATMPDGGREHVDHTDPATCMGLIKEYCIQLFPFCDGEIVRWDADIRPDISIVNCDTPEQAVARCVVAMRRGDSVDVPDDLGVQS
jgi:predicted hydrocarbon binding protein